MEDPFLNFDTVNFYYKLTIVNDDDVDRIADFLTQSHALILEMKKISEFLYLKIGFNPGDPFSAKCAAFGYYLKQNSVVFVGLGSHDESDNKNPNNKNIKGEVKAAELKISTSEKDIKALEKECFLKLKNQFKGLQEHQSYSDHLKTTKKLKLFPHITTLDKYKTNIINLQNIIQKHKDHMEQHKNQYLQMGMIKLLQEYQQEINQEEGSQSQRTTDDSHLLMVINQDYLEYLQKYQEGLMKYSNYLEELRGSKIKELGKCCQDLGIMKKSIEGFVLMEEEKQSKSQGMRVKRTITAKHHRAESYQKDALSRSFVKTKSISDEDLLTNAEKMEEYDQLQKDMSKLTKQLQKKENEVASLKERIHSLHPEPSHDDTNASIVSLRQRLKDSEKDNSTLRTLLNHKLKEIKDLQRKLKDPEEKIKEMERELKKLTKRITGLERDNKRWMKEVNEKEERIKEMARREKEYMNRITFYETEMKTRDEEIIVLQTGKEQSPEQEMGKQDNSEIIQQLKKELNEALQFKNEFNILRKSFDKQANKLEDITEANTSMQKELEEKIQEREDFVQRIEDLENELKETNEKLKKKNIKNSKYKDYMREKDEQLEQSQMLLQKVQKKYKVTKAVAKQEKELQEDELQKLQIQLSSPSKVEQMNEKGSLEKEAIIKNLEAKIEILIKSMENLEKEKEHIIEDLKKLDSEEIEHDRNEHTLIEYEAQIQKLQTELFVQTDQVDSLALEKEELQRSCSTQIREAKETISNLQKSIKEREKQLHDQFSLIKQLELKNKQNEEKLIKIEKKNKENEETLELKQNVESSTLETQRKQIDDQEDKIKTLEDTIDSQIKKIENQSKMIDEILSKKHQFEESTKYPQEINQDEEEIFTFKKPQFSIEKLRKETLQQLQVVKNHCTERRAQKTQKVDNLNAEERKYYKTIKEMKGHLTSAFLLQNRLKRYVVGKELSFQGLNKQEKKESLLLVQKLKDFVHPNILQILDFFLDHDVLHLVLEYVQGGGLDKHVMEARKTKEYLEEKSIINWFIQAVNAMIEAHKMNILHSAIKPQNVFLTKEGTIKLGDFRIIKEISDFMTFAFPNAGITNYLAPELVTEKKFAPEADIWGLGITFYEVCTKSYPEEIKRKALENKLDPLPKGLFSPELYELFKRMLHSNPNQRISLHETRKILMDIKEKTIKSKLKKENVTKRMKNLYYNACDDINIFEFGKTKIVEFPYLTEIEFPPIILNQLAYLPISNPVLIISETKEES